MKTAVRPKPFAVTIIPLAIGVLMYAAFRGIALCNLPPVLPVRIVGNPALSFIVYSVPDGLWLYALLQSLYLVWGSDLFQQGRMWLVMVSLGAPCSEVAQYYHVIPGTFDTYDIVAYMLATICFLLQCRTALNPVTKPITI